MTKISTQAVSAFSFQEWSASAFKTVNLFSCYSNCSLKISNASQFVMDLPATDYYDTIRQEAAFEVAW